MADDRQEDGRPDEALGATDADRGVGEGRSADEGRGRRLRRVLLRTVIVGAAVFVALQLVPYGWTHSNPPVTSAAPWPNAEAEAIARQSCYDCHSNETDWPAYSYVAPMSWLVRNDVETGRSQMNFSEWDVDDNEADDAVEQIEEGNMPLSKYTAIHRGAKLTDEERVVLIDALRQMASDDHHGKGGGGDDDGDSGGGDDGD